MERGLVSDDRDELGEALRAARPELPGGLARRLGMALARARVTGCDLPFVDRFEILTKVGEGGMGVVFRARDPMLERDVAIKVLRVDADGDAQARVRSEARALARLSHPHVLIVHDMGMHDGQLWLATEFVSGGTLRQWAARQAFGWRDLLSRFVDAARGLEAAHEAGVSHRDFKPDNVMVGEDGRVRVSDFGLAVIDALPDSQQPFGEASIVGTPTYLPPESLRGESAGTLGDQYSFCVSLQEMLAQAADLDELPQGVARLVERGRSSDPAQRWPSMAAVVKELQAALAAPSPSASRAAPPRPPSEGDTYDGLEVSGGVVRSWIDAFKIVRHVPHTVLAKHGIGRITDDGLDFDPDAFYPMIRVLAAIAEFASILGPKKLFEAGTQVPRHAVLPPTAHDVVSAMQAFDVGYHLNHRKHGVTMYDPRIGTSTEGIGHYRCVVAEEQRIVMEVDAPYQCDFDQGIMLSWARRFEPSARIVHLEPTMCRKRSVPCCRYELCWG